MTVILSSGHRRWRILTHPLSAHRPAGRPTKVVRVNHFVHWTSNYRTREQRFLNDSSQPLSVSIRDFWRSEVVKAARKYSLSAASDALLEWSMRSFCMVLNSIT